MSEFKRRGDEAEEVSPAPETAETKEKKEKQSETAVWRYIISLFIVVVIVMVLSYFVQQRHNNSAITALTEQHSEFTIQAMQNIERLQTSNEDLTRRLEDSEAKERELEARLEEALAQQELAQQAAAEAAAAAESQLNEQRMKTEALAKLLELYMAAQDENAAAEDLEEPLRAAEALSGYLDGAYAELFGSIKQQLQE